MTYFGRVRNIICDSNVAISVKAGIIKLFLSSKPMKETYGKTKEQNIDLAWPHCLIELLKLGLQVGNNLFNNTLLNC